MPALHVGFQCLNLKLTRKAKFKVVFKKCLLHCPLRAISPSAFREWGIQRNRYSVKAMQDFKIITECSTERFWIVKAKSPVTLEDSSPFLDLSKVNKSHCFLEAGRASEQIGQMQTDSGLGDNLVNVILDYPCHYQALYQSRSEVSVFQK